MGEKADRLAATGAQPIVCDVFDREALAIAVRTFSPDVVLHELTDLPDDVDKLPDAVLANARIRVEGTRNLLGAVQNWEHTKIVAQSIAVASLEKDVLGVNGVVIRYGRFYGPGTYYEGDPPEAPRVHIDTAAARTLDALDARPGIMTVVDN